MTRRFLIIAIVLLAVVLLVKALRGGSNLDEKLAQHIDKMCSIAGKHVDSPRKGVDKLFAYLGKNTEKIGAEFGALLVTIERIQDDAKHDRRAREAARLIHGTTARCQETFERFFTEVERDPEAKEKLERGTERLGRTLSILFGSAHHVSIPGVIEAHADHRH